VGVGDAENDLAFLALCECAVAVANALPSTRDKADWVTDAGHSDGVCQLIDALLANDLYAISTRLTHRNIVLGMTESGEPVNVPPYGRNVLLAGSSGGGKSTAATAFLERLGEQGYQYCIIDPEGDYAALEGAVVLGDEQGAPGLDEILTTLERPDVNLVINLVNIGLHDRPAYFERLLPRLLETYARTGRPHWLVLDEAHHVLPAEHSPLAPTLLGELPPILWVTVYPDHLSHISLEQVDVIVAIGHDPGRTLKKFASALRQPAPSVETTLETGEAIVWEHRHGRSVRKIRIEPPREQMRRHKRKYAQGDLGPELSFYFQGPEQKLNLRANNLLAFLQIAEGVDDATWDYHLRRGDYSYWFLNCIKDPQLAEATRQLEHQSDIEPPDSRARVRAMVEERYTGPA
ncbi:MAG TPA: HAD hydrolase family protein, partial [Gammaproteobacteria bacterium]